MERLRPQPATPPSFTGQDGRLSSYRRAISSQRLTSQTSVPWLVFGSMTPGVRQTNHDGFGPADEFFENKGWTSINENLASGYATAVKP